MNQRLCRRVGFFPLIEGAQVCDSDDEVGLDS
jgi:hypothetical protein